MEDTKKKMLSIYKQPVPGKLLKKIFERVEKEALDDGEDQILAYYSLNPNLGIFESQQYLSFNTVRYSPRSRCDAIIERILLQPAYGERLSNASVRKYAFVSYPHYDSDQSLTQMFKREVIRDTYTEATGVGNRTDLVDIEARVQPSERPELRRHRNWHRPRSTYDHQVRDFFKKIKGRRKVCRQKC